MQRLPIWVLNHRYPSVFDSESKTCIEQTARVYGAMQDLIDEYNKFAEETNKTLEAFEKEMREDNTEFKEKIVCLMENYIKSIDQTVNNAVMYMKTNLPVTLAELLNKGIKDGTLTVGTAYDEVTESLNLIIEGEVNPNE